MNLNFTKMFLFFDMINIFLNIISNLEHKCSAIMYYIFDYNK